MPPENDAPATETAANPAAPTPAAAAPTTLPRDFDPNAEVDWDADLSDADWKVRARKWERDYKRERADREADPRIAEYNKLVEASKTDLQRAQDAANAASAKVEAANARTVRAEVKALAANGFADPEDAGAFLALGDYLTADGDVDTEKIRTDLTDLLARKPHLAKAAGPRPPAPNPAQGSSASGAPDLEAQIAAAVKAGDVGLQVRLQNQKLLAPLKP